MSNALEALMVMNHVVIRNAGTEIVVMITLRLSYTSLVVWTIVTCYKISFVFEINK